MEERGVEVDHTTLYRWVQKYAPELEKRIRWHARTFCRSWHLDETYLRVKGKWKYLYRAIDKNGGTIDFMLSSKRNYQAAYNFLKNALMILLQKFRHCELRWFDFCNDCIPTDLDFDS
ncbi:hypothetical protein IM40_10465 (plasmid) [Candidatus Paracaedimonas acanthamoebae]|nr:hypothetical protein IM40_10465 [Candidatus Paracaedimonas acanthamoebae]